MPLSLAAFNRCSPQLHRDTQIVCLHGYSICPEAGQRHRQIARKPRAGRCAARHPAFAAQWTLQHRKRERTSRRAASHRAAALGRARSKLFIADQRHPPGVGHALCVQKRPLADRGCGDAGLCRIQQLFTLVRDGAAAPRKAARTSMRRPTPSIRERIAPESWAMRSTLRQFLAKIPGLRLFDSGQNRSPPESPRLCHRTRRSCRSHVPPWPSR